MLPPVAPSWSRAATLPGMLARIHALALDSVAVLLAAQWAVCSWGAVRCPPSSYAFLAAGIWLGYTADRFADVRADPPLADRTFRHAFHARWKRALTGVWIVVFVASWIAAALVLPSVAIAWGSVLAGAAGLYAFNGGALRRRSLRGEALPETRRPGRGPRGAGSRRAGFSKSLAASVLLTGAVAWGPFTLGRGDIEAGSALLVLAFFALAAHGNLVLLGRARRRRPPVDRERDTLGLTADVALIGVFVALALVR